MANQNHFDTKLKKPLIVLTGPTAVGKTALSIKLAKKIGGEIISADSMQVYQTMDIGTAKVREEEMQGVPHHLIDIFPPEHAFNVTEFQSLAKKAADEIYQRGHIPIVAGGTGFYIQALLYDIDFKEEGEEGELHKKYYEEELQKKDSLGLGASYREELFLKLKGVDPESADIIGKNNIKRVIRALCYYELHNEKISTHNKEERTKESAYNSAYFVLTMDRSKLYQRIDLRIDAMVKEGLWEETEQLMKRGLTKEHLSMQAIGYKELVAYYNGECTKEEAVQHLRLDTKHFAKRQMTWFRREKDVIFLDKDQFSSEDAILDEMIQILIQRKIIESTQN